MAKTERTMEERAVTALYQTWQQIGYDALQCMVDCGEAKNIDRAVMTREEVIDMVTSCGFKGGYPMDNGGDKEAVLWLDAQPRAVQNSICRKAFPHERYGS